jgi:hypothetical protein
LEETNSRPKRGAVMGNITEGKERKILKEKQYPTSDTARVR